MNHVWSELFGQGIVRTRGEFGVMGEWPTHRQLLDWLSCEFVDQGWNVKLMVRSIVLTAVYRQSSVIQPHVFKRDRYNRLLARASRFRPRAEIVRDSALVAGGILNRQIGGPSVFPLQPRSAWMGPPFYGTGSLPHYPTSSGSNRFRRGLYTFVRRASPHPFSTVFDAPDRRRCTVQRQRTNTPQQALTTLNEQTFLWAAGGLAENMRAFCGDTRKKIEWGYRRCTANRPTQKEVDILHSVLNYSDGYFESEPGKAKEFVSTCLTDWFDCPHDQLPNLAAWCVVGNTLLNLDATLMRE